MNGVHETTFRGGIVVGGILVVLGVAAYVLTEFASVTALIPAIFGVAFVALARLGLDAGRLRVAVYGLALLALLGIAGSAMGIGDAVTLATGGDVERPAAAVSQALMAILGVAMLALSARSILAMRNA